MAGGRPRQFDRDRALHAAMIMFWDKGYHDTSVADLRAVMGGISSASFYAAFTSKEALFDEVIDLYGRTCGEVVSYFSADGETALNRLKAGLEKSAMMQTNASEHPLGCLTVLSIPTCDSHYDSVFLKVAKVRLEVKEAIASCIDGGIKSGEFRSDLDPVGASILVSAFLQGVSIQARDGCTFSELRKAIHELLVGLTP